VTHKPRAGILTAFSQAAIALGDLRRGGDSYELARDLAAVFREHLGPRENGLMLGAFIQSVEPRDAVYLCDFLNSIFDETEEEDGTIPPPTT